MGSDEPRVRAKRAAALKQRDRGPQVYTQRSVRAQAAAAAAAQNRPHGRRKKT
jgi:hypothetical protein